MTSEFWKERLAAKKAEVEQRAAELAPLEEERLKEIERRGTIDGSLADRLGAARLALQSARDHVWMCEGHLAEHAKNAEAAAKRRALQATDEGGR